MSGPGILTATTPAQARRSWPRWAALGVALIAVAVGGLIWHEAGARLVLGAAGLAGAGRGALLVRAAALGTVEERARPLGLGTGVLGLAAFVVAVLPGSLAGRVLTVGVPLLLFLVSAALLARPGAGRRGGQVLVVWSVLVTGLLVAAAASGGWTAAVGVATVVAALCLAVLGVPLLVGAAGLRSTAAQAEPPAPAGCAGCACGAGGCGAALGG
jgi:hypothetical protein